MREWRGVLEEKKKEKGEVVRDLWVGQGGPGSQDSHERDKGGLLTEWPR